MSSRREIDIHLDLYDRSGALCGVILIENKLDTEPQPEQAESYREEINLLSRSTGFAAMLLLCPASYAAERSVFAGNFDMVLPYEEIARWLAAKAAAAEGEVALRLGFRAELIEQAVTKARRGYEAVPVPRIGDFNTRYVALLDQVAPTIRPGPTMLRPMRPAESVSMIFDHAASLPFLDPKVPIRRFAHELGRGLDHRANYVAVTFAGWGRILIEARDDIEAAVEGIGAALHAPRATEARPNPGLILSLPTPPVNNQGDFDAQIDRIRQGILQAARLRDWLADNRPLLAEWSRLANRGAAA
jgi:hypothetical protein